MAPLMCRALETAGHAGWAGSAVIRAPERLIVSAHIT